MVQPICRPRSCQEKIIKNTVKRITSYFEVDDRSILQSQLGQSLVIFERFPFRFQAQLLSVDVLVFGLLPSDTILELPDSEGVENVEQGHQGLVGLGVHNLQLDVHV